MAARDGVDGVGVAVWPASSTTVDVSDTSVVDAIEEAETAGDGLRVRGSDSNGGSCGRGGGGGTEFEEILDSQV